MLIDTRRLIAQSSPITYTMPPLTPAEIAEASDAILANAGDPDARYRIEQRRGVRKILSMVQQAKVIDVLEAEQASLAANIDSGKRRERIGQTAKQLLGAKTEVVKEAAQAVIAKLPELSDEQLKDTERRVNDLLDKVRTEEGWL